MHVESWIVRPPPSVTTVSKADINKTLSCLVAEDGTDHPNPWFDQDKKQVTDDSERGITVTSNLVPGTSTAVEWKLTFTNLSQEVIPNTGVSYTCKGSHSTATAMLNRASEWCSSSVVCSGASINWCLCSLSCSFSEAAFIVKCIFL